MSEVSQQPNLCQCINPEFFCPEHSKSIISLVTASIETLAPSAFYDPRLPQGIQKLVSKSERCVFRDRRSQDASQT